MRTIARRLWGRRFKRPIGRELKASDAFLHNKKGPLGPFSLTQRCRYAAVVVGTLRALSFSRIRADFPERSRK
jgi:hypothetical protein